MDLIGGGVDSQGGYISKILYVKMKELGPLGGCVLGTPPRSANDNGSFLFFSYLDVVAVCSAVDEVSNL